MAMVPVSRRRPAPGNHPLLGMIVDRSSFDEGDPNRESQEKAKENPLLPTTMTKDGKVRRKLRWKPAAFRNRRKRNSSTASVMSSGENSNRTTRSIHTFHSTDTPIFSNKTNEIRAPISRPNYRDTFDGVSTIDNEGKFIQARRFPEKRASHSSQGGSMGSAESDMDSDLESWDLGSIEDGERFNPYGEEGSDAFSKHVFDPLGSHLDHPGPNGSRKRAPRRPTPTRNPQQPSPSPGDKPAILRRTPLSSPIRKNQSPGGTTIKPGRLRRGSSPSHPDHPMNTTASTHDLTDEDLEASVPLHFRNDMERERQIDFFKSRLVNEPDAAAGLGISPIKFSGNPSPFATPVRGAMGKPPIAPMPRKPAIIRIESPTMESPDAIPAKVDIDLTAPSNLTSLMTHSGSGMNSPKKEVTKHPTKAYNRPVDSMAVSAKPANETQEKSAFKAYNRPVDSMTIPRTPSDEHRREGGTRSPSSSTISSVKGKRLVSDDESLSTAKSSVDRYQQDSVVIITSKDAVEPIAGNVVSHGVRISQGSITTRKSQRAKTGPVDVDDGAFVEAERHLKAIHEMAAEHLAHGEYEEALEVFEEILRGQRERYGPDHYRIGTALHNIGIVHLKSGNNVEAIEICKAAVEVRKRALVPNHPDVAVSLAQLGVAHLECQEYREALVALREALQIRREFLGPKHPKVGKILNNIGCVLYEMDELEGSRLAFEEALEIQRETLRSAPTAGGDENESRAASNCLLLSIGSTLTNIGSIRLRCGQPDDATVLLEEALLIQQSVLGDDHPAVLKTIDMINQIDDSDEQREDMNVNVFLASLAELTGPKTCTPPPQLKEPPVVPKTSEPPAQPPPSGGSRMTGMSFFQNFSWNRSKKWYQRVEEILPVPNAPCGSSDEEK